MSAPLLPSISFGRGRGRGKLRSQQVLAPTLAVHSPPGGSNENAPDSNVNRSSGARDVSNRSTFATSTPPTRQVSMCTANMGMPESVLSSLMSSGDLESNALPTAMMMPSAARMMREKEAAEREPFIPPVRKNPNDRKYAEDAKKRQIEEMKFRVTKEKRVTIELDENEIDEETNSRRRKCGAHAIGSDEIEHELVEEDDLVSINKGTIDDPGTIGVVEREIPMDDNELQAMKSKYFSSNRRNAAETSLPIEAYEKRIMESVDAARVVIIQGATGCGKTTQVPQMIMRDCIDNRIPFNIICTQPRRIAAKSIAKRVCDENGWELGSICGYQIGMDREYVTPDTRLVYCTVGVLVQKLIMQQSITHYTHIILDEVHERSEDTDLLMMIIKKFMMSIDFSAKIILMSATFDVDKLIEYFTIPSKNDPDNVVPPSKFAIEEKPAELVISYLNQFFNSLVYPNNELKGVRSFESLSFSRDEPGIPWQIYDLAARLVIALDKQEGNKGYRGAVLIFVPGYHEIQEMEKMLKFKEEDEKKEKNRSHNWVIHPLHSSVTVEQQCAVFGRVTGNERKVIISTNIAESSITVSDIDYVIDFCLTKNLVCDPDTHFPTLQLEWAAKSNCDQRAGRTGRVSKGRVYRLVPERFYDQFEKYQPPEIERSPLELSVLRVKRLAIYGPPKELLGLTLDPPNLSDIHQAVLHLKQIGALTVKIHVSEQEKLPSNHHQPSISRTKSSSSKHLPLGANYNPNDYFYDHENGDLTCIGEIMSSLPIDVRLSKLIIMGHILDVLDDCITIAACLTHKGMFRRPFNQEIDAYKSRFAWSDRSFSDCIAFLKAFNMYQSYKDSGYFDVDTRFGERGGVLDKWCRQNYIQLKKIKDVEALRLELVTRLRREGIEVPIRPNQKRIAIEEELILKIAICGAFYPHYFMRNEIDKDTVNKMISTKDPFATVMIQGLPQNQGILYARSIRDEIAKHTSTDVMDLDFEETRCFITFLDDSNALEEAERNKYSCEFEALARYDPSGSRGGDGTSHFGPLTGPFANPHVSYAIPKIRETIIKMSVYFAVACKHWHVLRSFNYYEPKKAQLKLRELERDKQRKKEEIEKKACKNMLISHRIAVPMVNDEYDLPSVPLPSPYYVKTRVRVTHVVDAGHFWCQYISPHTEQMLEQLSQTISYIQETVKCDETIRLGDLVITMGNDGVNYHRAKVIKIDYVKLIHDKPINLKNFNPHQPKAIKSVTVRFVDYGSTKVVPQIDMLSRIVPENDPLLITIPTQAFECQLAHLKPSALKCLDNNWDDESTKWFTDIVSSENAQLEAQVFSIVNKVVRCELIASPIIPTNELQYSININDQLLSLLYADKWEENSASMNDHKYRRDKQMTLAFEEDEEEHYYKPEIDIFQEVENVEDRDPDDLDSIIGTQPDLNLYNINDIITLDIDRCDLVGTTRSANNTQQQQGSTFTHETFHLKGPFSPLEASFVGCTKQTCSRKIQIERDSVNAVVLESDYLSRHSRMLVASTVQLSQATGSVIARDTTLMPNIKGFPHLMTLLFAPRVELRIDRSGSKYVGAICGIGYDDETRKSFDPENDIALNFDTDISREDIVLINLIRFNISDVLSEPRSLIEFPQGRMSLKQRKIRKLLFRLMQRFRRYEDNSRFGVVFKWGLLSPTYLSEDTTDLKENVIFPIINPLNMESIYDYYTDFYFNKIELDEMCEEIRPFKPTCCKLCDSIKLYQLNDLKFHLLSINHCEKANSFNKEYINEKKRRQREAEEMEMEDDEDESDNDKDDNNYSGSEDESNRYGVYGYGDVREKDRRRQQERENANASAYDDDEERHELDEVVIEEPMDVEPQASISREHLRPRGRGAGNSNQSTREFRAKLESKGAVGGVATAGDKMETDVDDDRTVEAKQKHQQQMKVKDYREGMAYENEDYNEDELF